MKVTIALLFTLFTAVTLRAQTVKLGIVVNNIQAGKGNIVLNVYNKEENWFKTAFIKKIVKADQSSMTISLEVPEGTYGIAVFQDLDSNGELKYGMFKIPKEPVAFGNNFKPKMSAPSFSDCAVTVKGNSAVTLKLY